MSSDFYRVPVNVVQMEFPSGSHRQVSHAIAARLRRGGGQTRVKSPTTGNLWKTLVAASSLSIAVAADRVRLSLRLSPSGCESAAACFGCDLPDKIGGISSSEDRIALCLGPDEWFLMAPLSEQGESRRIFAWD
jgi:sarcosine oxidase gamma subunit